jgi:ketosteroid isomerase-like protein
MDRRIWPLAIVLALSLGWPAPAAGQAAKPGKPGKPAPDTQQKDTGPLVPRTDQQAVDYAITEMLGAWQIGDIELMHKYYADDVLVVSGFWEPPVIGWEKYAQAYQRQRARMQGVELNRSNSYQKVVGTMAWAVYQWTFTGQVDGKITGFRGHTTLVFEKRGANWLIVVNHTSVADLPPTVQTPPATPAGATPPAPTKPPGN